ncbi:hypothetical protein INR49_012826, partial [Caranx melampygus]
RLAYAARRSEHRHLSIVLRRGGQAPDEADVEIKLPEEPLSSVTPTSSSHERTGRLYFQRMASCGEVDHSVSSLPSSKKGSNSGGGSGSSAESSCSGSSNSSPALSVPECAICLQSCVHPVQLPCHHVFCFLCVKGASWQSKRCALCRQEVPDDFLERPTLLSPEELKASAGGRGGAASDHAWYYEGRNGWWQYDERTSRELEDAFSKGKKTAEMLIAGFLYVADLENMVQYRRNEHGRRRKMKRDVLDIPKKGVAGLRLDTEGVTGAIGAAGRENSADGADTIVAGVQQPVTGISSTVTAPPPTARPPTSLGGQPGTSTSPSLEDDLSQLQISQGPHLHMSGLRLGKERKKMRRRRFHPPGPLILTPLWTSQALETGVMMRKRRTKKRGRWRARGALGG